MNAVKKKKKWVYKKMIQIKITEWIQPESECAFPFQYIINFELGNFWNPSSTPGEDRHVRALSFLWKIELSTTFICTIF